MEKDPEQEAREAAAASEQLLREVKRLMEGFEGALLNDDTLPQIHPVVLEGLEEMSQAIEDARQKELKLRENLGLQADEFQKLVGDVDKSDPKTRKLLEEIKGLKERLDEGEAQIMLQFKEYEKAYPDRPLPGRRYKSKKKRLRKKGLKKRFKRFGRDGWLPS